jgi:hypothetical protein
MDGREMKSSPKETVVEKKPSPNLGSAHPKSLRTRLTLSFLGVIVATAALVILLTNRITANRFTYMVSAAGQRYATRLAPLFAEAIRRGKRCASHLPAWTKVRLSS